VNDSQPVFSPDGERIAFRSDRDGGGLFVMGRTGESVRKLTTDGFNPSWSPDGASIVYATQPTALNPGSRGAKSVLWIASTTSGERRQLTNDTARDRRPIWSADGKRLMFYSDRSGRYQVWTIAADGGGLTQVTDFPGLVIEPVRAVDGTRAFAQVVMASKVLMFDPRLPATQQKPEELPPFPGAGFRATTWSPARKSAGTSTALKAAS